MRTALWVGAIGAVLLVVFLSYTRSKPRPVSSGPITFLSASTATVGTDTIDLSEVGFSRGHPDAPVAVLEFSDFGCPFCAMFARGTYPDLAAEFVEAGQVRWILIPFASGRFPNADDALRAALCAADQDEFFAMTDRLYASQRDWMRERRAESLFRAYGDSVGLDRRRFETCTTGSAVRTRMAAVNRATDLLRVYATPTFIVGENRFEGSLPTARFRELILRELERKAAEPAPL